MNRQRAATALGVLASIMVVTGCANPNEGLDLRPGQNVGDMALRRDIVQVKKFYPGSPWLSFDEAGDPNPEGFKVNVYLVSAANGRGAFGDGNIIVTMYSLPGRRPDTAPPAESKLEKRWVLTPGDCMPFRATRKTVMGFGYGLRLNWGDVDVLGETILITIAFERRDGTIIKSQPQTFRVPPRRTAY
ncbi:MAG: hypothetical protein JSU68_14645 [Phycisphaerales bacterium]|nr:MAG: hypothetical protein JSU68_14645 [Phycisphaerales bacterium]